METSRFQDFIGASEPMRMVYDAIQQVADCSINVLVRGESGTGKELVPRALVALSRRAKKPTVRGEAIRASHLPPNLLAQSMAAQERILLPEAGTDFDEEIERLEIALLTTALKRTQGSKSAAARLLHLDGQPMKYLCRKYFRRSPHVSVELSRLDDRSGTGSWQRALMKTRRECVDFCGDSR
jgi:DNA-binding NtrC family response regulator